MSTNVTEWGTSGTQLETLVAALREHARSNASEPAVTFVDYGTNPGGITTTLNYAQLDIRVRSLAAELQRRFQVGDHIAILCPQGVDYVAAFLACLHAGVRAVPLYPPEPFRNNSHLGHLLVSTNPAGILTTTRSQAAVEDFLGKESLPLDRHLLCVDAIDLQIADDWHEPQLDGDTVAYVQYTSGSTSSPSGVLVTHANLAHTVAQCQDAYGFAAERISVSWLPLFHDMGLVLGLTSAVALGRHAILMSPFAFVQRPARWLQLISAYRAPLTAAPNFSLDMCVDRTSPDELEGVDLSCLTVLINGSEPVRPQSLDRFTEAFAPYGFSHSAHTPSYGLAEATVIVTATPAADAPRVLTCDRAALAAGTVIAVSDEEADPRRCQRLLECGRPVLDQVAITDPDTGSVLPEDRVGEVWVCGANVTAGYHAQPARTREIFHAGPDHSWLRSGDLGFLHDGRLYVTGRRKDLIVIRGRNHHPPDIEATIESVDPRLRAGHVVAFSVDVDDAEQLIVVAETDPRVTRERPVDHPALVRAVRRTVAAHHGIDVHELVLVRKGSIPKTSSGKLRRDASRRRYLDRSFRSHVNEES